MGEDDTSSMKGIVLTLLFVNGLIVISCLSVIKFSDVNATETKNGNSTTTTVGHDSSPNNSGTLLVVESVKFANGSFPTVPPVEIGTVTVSGNNPTPSHFEVAAGDNEEGTEVPIGPGKYSVSISLPSNYKLVSTELNCTGVMTPLGSAQCTLNVQQQSQIP
jgi:hypothetical protein